MQITGILDNAQLGTGYSAGRLRGQVHGDANNRFPDGEEICTSRIVEWLSNDVFKTASGNFYQVRSWASGHEPARADEALRRLVSHLVECATVGWEGGDDTSVQIRYISNMADAPSDDRRVGIRVGVLDATGKDRAYEFVCREML